MRARGAAAAAVALLTVLGGGGGADPAVGSWMAPSTVVLVAAEEVAPVHLGGEDDDEDGKAPLAEAEAGEAAPQGANFLALKRFLETEYPDLEGKIHGDNYQPSWIVPYLLQGAGAAQIAGVVLMLFGDQIFDRLGMQTPDIIVLMRQYQMQTFLGLFVLSSVAQNMASSGAFEISLGDNVIFSKLQAGRMPRLEEVVNLLDAAGLERATGHAFEDRQI
ncbi:Selenoprotein T [Hondaea fermentalgiana]|uniref:Selenoprotein T n=1 Tax=Hondaea fermentalgiana TaxID=2315210 RepID=A0A2R5GKW1_9STRA|nr:Selenoprotein T [Hondaea fermentalgiana]|eukprot:GBG30949.1 Selenoprotein T [Hondaea fermentalgiana]